MTMTSSASCSTWADCGGRNIVSPFAMIDEGELDWKVVAISTADPRCEVVNDVEDMEVFSAFAMNDIFIDSALSFTITLG